MQENYNNFETDNMTFVAVCMLQNDFVIKAIPHRFPKFAGHCAYQISPRERAIDLFDKFQLDEILSEREMINQEITEVVYAHTESWGVVVSVVYVKDI